MASTVYHAAVGSTRPGGGTGDAKAVRSSSQVRRPPPPPVKKAAVASAKVGRLRKTMEAKAMATA